MVRRVSDLAIDLQGISKTYRGAVRALRDVVMEVRDGEIFGLLGPNGAGKSTLVKILLTIVRPTSCRGTMLGEAIGHRGTLGRVGYLPEHARFPEYLTGLEVMDFVGAMHNVPGAVRRRRAVELLAMVGLRDWGRRALRTYSKGMKQRLGLAQALVNKPALVILDEPTDGLDPVGRREVADVLRELRQRGTTVFLNSHLLGEAERLCDRVAILAGGQVVRQGTVDELTREGRRYEIRIEGNLPEVNALHTVISTLGGVVSFDAAAGSTVITLQTSRPQFLQPLIDELRRSAVAIEAIIPQRQSLEDYFIDVVRPGAATVPPALGEPATIKP
jgi:ABC-2 type transport system ATP-binding protein